MELEVKRPDHIVPSYSLTGDLLSYLRCRLQYRYHNGSALPPSRPVQLWFGEFLHGTLEMAYRYWVDLRESDEHTPDFPWPCTQRQWREDTPDWLDYDIGRFASTVEDALRQQGKQARSTEARNSAYRRVEAAVNEFGPHLFPLIASAERKVIGTRPVPCGPVDLRCDSYEVHGIIDVLTYVTLAQESDQNPICRYVHQACPNLEGTFEVIVDYKGSRRPLTCEPYWEQGDWQIQTYAWLRARQPNSLRVAAGILIYINELTPGTEEMKALQRGITENSTDVPPVTGSRDERIVRMWRPGMSTSQLSLAYRFRRAIRVIPITQESTDSALMAFDGVVRQAEQDVIAEANGENILQAWYPNCEDEATCAACDFRYFCPRPAGKKDDYVIEAPTAP